MTSIERKLLIETSVIGAMLTAVVLLLNLGGYVEPLEQYLYHRRARYFQVFTPPPTDGLVHLDIDDAALEMIGAWPWPRAHLAKMLDEITKAGADCVAFDVLFAEPQELRFKRLRDNTPGPLVNDDQVFAEAIERNGRVLMPLGLSIIPRDPPPQSQLAARRILMKDLQLEFEEVRRQVLMMPIPGQPLNKDLFVLARREAMYARIDQVMKEGARTLSEIRAALLPDTSPAVASAAVRVLHQQYERVAAMHALREYTIEPTLPTDSIMRAYDPLTPVVPLARAAGASGFVDHVPFSDGVVRAVPLWVRQDGRLFPQMGLALACLKLGVDLQDIQIGADYVRLPRRNQPDIVIPTRSHHVEAADQSYGFFLDVPWFGPPQQWRTMYDYPDYIEPRQHMPITDVWAVVQTRERIAENCRIIDEAIGTIWQFADPRGAERAKLTAYEQNRPAPGDFAARLPVLDEAMADAEAFFLTAIAAMPEQEFEGWIKEEPDAQVREDYRALRRVLPLVPIVREETPKLLEQLKVQEAHLQQLLGGKAVLAGWTATAAIADFVPTSLHAKCPGVVVHGTLFNGVMTGDMWRAAPGWVGPMSTVFLGLLATLVTAALSPMRSAMGNVVLAGGWIGLNGLALFDYGNLLVPMGAPLLAVALVWAGCTVFRFVAERAERERIKARFSSYVDPALVNYVLEHPDETSMRGQVRELTVVFTDLAGFTSISERLKERTVPLLNEYMGLMVPVIRDPERETHRRGYVNKFLGDGIMFFYGAPYENLYHAADAVSTALKMQQVLGPFNDKLADQGLPTVQMRAGISTGEMVVGDAGPPDASDYTVLGDTVNLAARLESANKATGTFVMLSGRTVELLDGLFLVRPIATLQVKGKTEGVQTFEPLAYADEATHEQRKLAEMTREMVELYRESRFFECIDATDRLDAEFGPSKLTAMYRDTCRHYLVEPPENFRGYIVLTEK